VLPWISDEEGYLRLKHEPSAEPAGGVAPPSTGDGEIDRAHWPTSSEYDAAIQRPKRAFSDEVLMTAKFDNGPFGLSSVEGQTAVVFFADTNEGPIALRCFKRPLHRGRERYHALADFLSEHPLPPLARADWCDGGMTVNDKKWPVIKMERVTGGSLSSHVASLLGSGGAGLSDLSERWRVLMADLRRARIAHGDLQHDNVRVTPTARGIELRLIDLDAIWTEATAEFVPAEKGHRHFQHPERLRTDHWDEYIDAFSALVIYVSLRALAADPHLWSYHNDENLIFSEDDYLHPGRTAIWSRLAASRDLDVRRLTQMLDQFCQQTVRIATDLETILQSQALPTAPAWRSADAGAPIQATWWDFPAAEPPSEDLPTSVDWWLPAASTNVGKAEQAQESASVSSRSPSNGRPATHHRRSRPRVRLAWAVLAALVVIIGCIVILMAG